MISTLTRMPAWARWALYATLGVFLLTLVQTISDTERLTQVATSREMSGKTVPSGRGPKKHRIRAWTIPR